MKSIRASYSTFSLALSLGISLTTYLPSAYSQDMTVHGAAAIALAGGGCSNLTGTVPPSYPGRPAGIPCNEYFTNQVTYQGSIKNADYLMGDRTSDSTDIPYQDIIGNVMITHSTDSRIQYGYGNDNYAEFAQDGASRVRWYEVRIPNLVNALNANPDVRSAVTNQKIVDGMGLGFQIEGNKQFLEVAKGQSKSFEFFPIDPENFAVFNNPNAKPFQLQWTTPNKSNTPHLNIPDGISFHDEFDSQLGHWRYFLDVDGTTLQTIGKYIVVFDLEETTFRMVQYRSAIEGLLSYPNKRWMRATLTIGYGIDQCAAQSGVAVPSMQPLLDTHSAVLKLVNKDYKQLRRALNGEQAGSAVRAQIPLMRRTIRGASVYNTEARQKDTQALTLNIAQIDTAAQTTLLLDLAATANRGAANGRLGSIFTIRRLVRRLSTLVPRDPRGSSILNRRGKPFTPKKYKKYIRQGDALLASYLSDLDNASERVTELKQNTAQCGAIQK